jgi:hypothetical protein
LVGGRLCSYEPDRFDGNLLQRRGNSDANANSNRDAHDNCHCNSNAYIKPSPDCNANAEYDSYAFADAYTKRYSAKAYSNAAASTYASASPDTVGLCISSDRRFAML